MQAVLSSVSKICTRNVVNATRAITTRNALKAASLKEILSSQQTDFLMEAHNGLSAKIVEETGFKGIWASGLSISASLGVRDSNEASWTQVLECVEFMNDHVDIPILLDGDTGFGNFNNARRLVKKLESRGVAGVCLEDKEFPKRNSFADARQPLASVEEFSRKIMACKDTQENPDFCVVARTEAFIAGWGLEETLKRATAYAEAGADAVLIHSKKADCTEIDAFMKEWNNRAPVVIVPTKYFNTPTQHFKDIGINTVIWANHNLRVCVNAMKELSTEIFNNQSIADVEKRVASVSEVFRLQNDKELQDAEKRYLPDC
eukprot:GCRY01000107.1.p1 GENE.GCRY01000107.1~~GCRY01000107.1.p1  ORF type:complete len:318 (-),score=82.31 GCRY01000107.1:292-1245(-)